MTDLVVVPATAADVPELAGVLAQAFTGDPMSAALLGRPATGPDAAARLRHLHAALLRSGPLRHGAVDVVRRAGGGPALGVAAWQSPGGGGSLRDEVREARAFVRALGARRLPEALRQQAVLARHRPRHPHWYLLEVGVADGARGLGVGSLLLGHRLAALDAEGQAAYLEASTPRSAALYARLGFVRLGPVRGLPTPTPPTSMWRPAAVPPRGGATRG